MNGEKTIEPTFENKLPTAEELKRLFMHWTKEAYLERYIRHLCPNPMPEVEIKIYQYSPDNAAPTVYPPAFEAWRGQTVRFVNFLSEPVKIAFKEPKVFGCAEVIGIPAGGSVALLVSATAPLGQINWAVGGGTGGGPIGVISDPPGP